MAAGYRFELNKLGVSEVANGQDIRREMRRRADNAASWVRANAPRDSGDFADSLRVEDVARGGPKRDRAEVRLVADSDHAVYVEYGAYGRDGEHLLTRAADFVRRGD